MLERWTRTVLRHRVAVLACWLAVLVSGLYAAFQLPGLLSTSYTVPGAESERARVLLASQFREQPESTFVVVFDVPRSSNALEAELRQRLAVAASLLPTGRAGELRDGDGIVYGEVDTVLGLTRAKSYTAALRRSLRAEGPPRAYVTGQPAIQHDADRIVRQDLRRAELIAVPIALAILAMVLGFSPAVAVSLLFAACTITGTLGVLYIVALAAPMATYVPTLVELIGLGLALDYSLLIVHRFREESRVQGSADSAAMHTMTTAGRAVIFSGLAVATGLAALFLVPVPFVRSMGLGGFLVPLVAIAAVLTLQPALLSLLASTPGRKTRTPRDHRHESGFWVRLARVVMQRPVTYLAVGALVLLGLSAPCLSLRLTPGSISDLPPTPEAMRGFARLTEGVGPGAVTPTQIVVDTGAPRGSDGPARAAIDRLADLLFHDPEVLLVASGSRPPYVDESRRHARVILVGRHEYGADASQALVRRLREKLIPAARFPPDVVASAGGIPPQGVDFLERVYGSLFWLGLAVLGVTYVVLLRAFRSLLLPLKAVVLNLLTVSAAYGLLVIVFQWGAGSRLLGLPDSSQIEGWVPIFLFAALWGLSMDYEVFLVSRMREVWDEAHDNRRAVAYGLARSGRVVTAAAAIMIVAFAGFVAGRVVGLQQLGFGLAVGVLLDVTIVRMLVLPSLMAVLGRWNWWLPESVARIARVEPSPLRP